MVFQLRASPLWIHSTRMRILAVAALILSQSSHAKLDPPLCNGGAQLCSRRYDQVVYPTTHNSFAHSRFIYPYYFVNQQRSIPNQLRDGIRGFMIDVHPYDGFNPRKRGEVYVCHQTCKLGGQPLGEVLKYFSDFLGSHPTEVITLIFESYVKPEQIAPIFDQVGLLPFTHVQDPQQPWPTLGEMIERGHRLVVFSDYSSGQPDWYMDVWAHATETRFAVVRGKDLTCDFNRGDPSNPLFIFNHFLARGYLRVWGAKKIGSYDIMMSRVRQCEQEKGKIPNFLTVDFYEHSDVVKVARDLNQ